MQDAARSDRQWTGHARIDVQVVDDAGPELTVRVSRHATQAPPEPDETLLTRFLTTVTPRPNDGEHSAARLPVGALTSGALAAWVGRHEAPELVVDRFMSQLPAARAAGALVDKSTCRVGLRSTLLPMLDDSGMLLTMTSETPGAPVELFPALLYSWKQWAHRKANPLSGRPQAELPPRSGDLDEYAGRIAGWLEKKLQQPDDRPVVSIMPVQPFYLSMVEDGRLFRVRVHDFDHTRWPDQPTRAHNVLGPE